MEEVVSELRDRSKFIGGSDAAAILGVSPYKTAYQLWAEKTGQVVDTPDPMRERYFRRGRLMEPVVVQMAREEYGLEITAHNQRYFDKEFPFLSCEIDFEWMDLSGPQNADVKTVNPFMAREWGEEGTDEIPDYYTVQFLFGQMIRERERTLCTALIGSDDLRIYRTERDDEMIRHIREACVEFWAMVKERRAPKISTIEDAKLCWKKDARATIVATQEIADMVECLNLLKSSISGDEAKAKAFELDIKQYLAENTTLVGGDGKKIVSWKSQKTNRFDQSAFEKDHAELFAKYKKTTETRVFRIA